MSRAAGALLSLASCPGPRDLQSCLFALHPATAARQKDDVVALESEALASAPRPAGRKLPQPGLRGPQGPRGP